MNDTARILGRGITYSLTGLGVQLAATGLLTWLIHIDPNVSAGHAFWTSIAGILVWLHLLGTYILLQREARYEFGADGNKPADVPSISTKKKQDRIRLIHRTFQRVLLPIMELGAAALLIQNTFVGLSAHAYAASTSTVSSLYLVALYAVISLILIVISVYFSSLLPVKAWHLLKSGRNYNNLMGLVFLVLLVGACCAHFRIDGISAYIGWGFITVNTALSLEILLSMVLRLFAPRRPNTLRRPAFDLYLLEGLSQPTRIGHTVAAMLTGIFGFDITQTSFGRITRSLILPAILMIVTILAGLSSVVIIKPYEQAILLNLGRLSSQPLQPGLHLKLPWPLASVRRYNVAEIRSVHVGSHKPTRAGGDVYRAGIPILWTNMHGLKIDELLICSAPRGMVDAAVKRERGKPNARKVPSVSLAAADVQVQYIIDDLSTYVRSSSTPAVFLRNVAEGLASRSIYRYDIDALFCEARLALAGELRRIIQEACNRRRLGVRIVHVAINAVHPPVDVAGAFEETVAAMQERETKIQHARQRSIRDQVEATGSSETFARLALMADSVDAGYGADVSEHERLLLSCGGEVSRILAEAGAYRFSRENMERGKTERFAKQLIAHAASPQNNRYDHYFSILEKGLAESRKIVFLGNSDRTVVRMGLHGFGESVLSPYPHVDFSDDDR